MSTLVLLCTVLWKWLVWNKELLYLTRVLVLSFLLGFSGQIKEKKAEEERVANQFS